MTTGTRTARWLASVAAVALAAMSVTDARALKVEVERERRC